VHSLDGVSTGQLAMVVQPTFLYELLWNLLVFVVLLYLDRRFTIGHGRLFAAYVAGYCVGRFWIELLRDDTATHIAGIRINSFTSTFVLIGAVVYLVLAPKGREDPATLSGSAAELLEPDSIDDDSAPEAAESESQATTPPVVAEKNVDEPAVEESDAEAVAAEADAAEVDPPEVEVEPADEPASDDVDNAEETKTQEAAAAADETPSEDADAVAEESEPETAAEPEPETAKESEADEAEESEPAEADRPVADKKPVDD
jgi:hypothetical protein